MSSIKTRIPLGRARVLAAEVVELLAPACDRIEIAGSIRRGKPDIGDIEILCIPKLEHPQDIFGFGEMGVPHNHLDAKCRELLDAGLLEYRLNRNRQRAWGEKNKLGWYLSPSGGVVAVDIFSTTAEQWGVYFAVRTGPAKVSELLVTARRHGGALPGDWKVRGWRLQKSPGNRVETPEEADFFAALGLPVIPPAERSEERLKQEVRKALAGQIGGRVA